MHWVPLNIQMGRDLSCYYIILYYITAEIIIDHDIWQKKAPTHSTLLYIYMYVYGMKYQRTLIYNVNAHGIDILTNNLNNR